MFCSCCEFAGALRHCYLVFCVDRVALLPFDIHRIVLQSVHNHMCLQPLKRCSRIEYTMDCNSADVGRCSLVVSCDEAASLHLCACGDTAAQVGPLMRYLCRCLVAPMCLCALHCSDDLQRKSKTHFSPCTEELTQSQRSGRRGPEGWLHCVAAPQAVT